MVRVIERQDRRKNCPAAIFTPRQPDVSLGPLGLGYGEGRGDAAPPKPEHAIEASPDRAELLSSCVIVQGVAGSDWVHTEGVHTGTDAIVLRSSSIMFNYCVTIASTQKGF